MTVPQKLKLLIECNDLFNENASYADVLIEVLPDLSGFPKVEINGDPAEEIRYVTTDIYNEEKYELLGLEDNFEIVSVDEEEVQLCAGDDAQAPLTFSVRANTKTGKLHITDIYQGFNDGLSFDEFDDIMRNL